MSEECGKLKGAITEIEGTIATIYATKLAATDHVRDEPETGHQCNAIMERQANYYAALLITTNNKTGMNAIVLKGQVTGQDRVRTHLFRRGAIAGPYIGPNSEDHLVNHLKELYHLDNLHNILV